MPTGTGDLGADAGHLVSPLIGLAHGSRDPRAAVWTAELMAAVAALEPGLLTRSAYLDLVEPDLTTALRELAAPEVVVVPLLFSRAYHARVDAPQAVADATRETGTQIRIAEILGLPEQVLAGLLVRAAEAGIPDEAGIVVAAVGSSSDEANDAVAALAARWSASRPGPVLAAFATAGSPQVPDALAELADRGESDGPAGGGVAVGVVPLFAAPGLLLDVIARHAADLAARLDRPVPVAAPLGTLLAPLVLDRYRAARSTA